VSEWITGGSCCNVGHSKTREHQNSSTWFLPASTPRHHMDPPKRAPYRSKRSIEKTRKQDRILLVLGEQTLMRSRKFLWSQPPSIYQRHPDRNDQREPQRASHYIYAPEETKGVVTTRVAAEDQAAKPGLRGRCDDLGHRKSLEVTRIAFSCNMRSLNFFCPA
jgi:hypothetical protein